jgi:penicillin amidase
LKFTRHGAVVYEDHARRRAYAVRSVWFEPGSAPYFASVLTMRAKSFEAFRTGMARWGVPAVNQVYADTSGTIAWLPAGFSPVRPNWDGLLPVPGDGRYEWVGFFPAADWPVVVDPEDGYFATANEQNLPTDWPHDEKQVGYEWAERSRMDRIVEVFSAGGAHTIEASCALQMDVKSLPAERLTALVRNLAAGLAEEAKAVFARWDHRLRPESGAAALFEVWWSKHLRGGVVSRLVADTDSRALIAPGDVATILAVLEAPDRRFGDDPIAARDGLLATTLATAWADCVALLGADPGRWAWGTLHKGYFAHALSATGVAKDAGLDVGPLGMGGSESTPMNARYRNSDFRVMTGASVRLVIDVGAWDNSVAINAPGQSGDPKSPHYGDLAELWAEGRYVPLLYTRGAIAEATRTLLTLMPTNGSQRPQA